MVARQTRSAIVLFLAILIGLSIAQASGSLSSPVAADNNLTFQNLSTSGPNDATPVLQVEPTAKSISAGSYAQFELNIDVGEPANVLLVSNGIPDQSVVIFTPENGIADPNFNSLLTIVTSSSSPPGSYNITVAALVGGQELSSDVSLQIASATPQTNNSLSVPASSSLSVRVETDQSYYKPNETVNIRGVVMDSAGSAIPDADLSIQVDGPTGSEPVQLTGITTDAAGVFQTYLTIPINVTSGAYTVFAAASKSGYATATTHTNYVIDSSSTSSVMIIQLYSTDATNKTSAVFSVGQTVLIWIVLQNIGAPIQGVIWIQILDPRGTLVSIQLQISTLATGGIVKVAFGFSPTANSAQGIYNANALVSDKLISQGGTFLANANAQFVLGE
ncbi:MAG TPA: MG2 domain-containing protein [Candidatus Bathyarchaeia archaeon]|nr:MG2 domain-containing protein [Candidatus Bathyarchaeia archaeon]